MSLVELLILAGAFAGGLVSGLTGFGTSVTALAFWLHVVPPLIAAPLAIVCSVVAHLLTLPSIWHAIDRRLVAPFIIPGLLGVPLGTQILPLIPVDLFKMIAGGVLLAYCLFMLVHTGHKALGFGGRIADAAIGFGGGVLGGLAGLSGILPTVWARLRGWKKDRQRAVFQSYNLAILATAGVSQWFGGFLTVEVWKLVLLALPGTIAGAWIGRAAYGRIGSTGFNRAVLLVLLLSAATLLAGL